MQNRRKEKQQTPYRSNIKTSAWGQAEQRKEPRNKQTEGEPLTSTAKVSMPISS
jgi:hypothetical protein